MNADRLAALYAGKGLPCQIEAAVRGLIIYAPTRDGADRVARDILGAVRARDPRAQIVRASRDADEPPETSWWSAVDFDWRRF